MSRRVFVTASAAEPFAGAALSRRLADLEAPVFEGAFLAGVNRFDWSTIFPGARMAGPFMSPAWREADEAGRFDRLPLTYLSFARRVASARYAAGLFMVTPPDGQGLCSLGVAGDFAPLALDRCAMRIAVINPALPRLPGAPTVPLSIFDEVVEHASPPVEYAVRPPGPVETAILGHVAGLVPNGATLQGGLGRLGDGLWTALAGKEGLSIHSGMICDPVAELIAGGQVSGVVTGSLLGSGGFYARAPALPQIVVRPVTHTHHPATLAAIPRFVAVNSALEVDLLGQVNAEWADGQAVSGPGGLPDFIRGAHLSPGGLPVIALGATAKGGAVSRIVPRLSVPPTLGAAEAGIVVTEHGVADLRRLDVRERAEAMIAIAAPDHRPALRAALAKGQD